MEKQYLIFILLLLTTVFACSKEELPEELPAIPGCETEDLSFKDDITPILDSSCFACHSSSAAFGNIILDTYEGVKETIENGRLLGSIRQEDGFSSMPQGGDKISDCNIDQIDSWIAAGAANN